MISTNALSLFILHHHQNRIYKNNLCSIQENVRKNEPDFKRYKSFEMISLISTY